MVRHHGHKLRVGGLSLADVYGVAEYLLDVAKIASLKRGLDAVSHTPFHPLGGGMKDFA